MVGPGKERKEGIDDGKIKLREKISAAAQGRRLQGRKRRTRTRGEPRRARRTAPSEKKFLLHGKNYLRVQRESTAEKGRKKEEKNLIKRRK